MGFFNDFFKKKEQATVESKAEVKKEKKPREYFNDDTELVFIIDRSGSMSGLEDDTIGGFNAMIEKQKSGEGRVYVSTVLFDNNSEVIHDRVDIKEIKPMTRSDYQVHGCTALLDALGGAVSHIQSVHKYIRREDVPRHTIFVITTDGMETASHSYTSARVKEMIKSQTDDEGWEFMFLAANIDAVETADSLGIRRERAANYEYSRAGVERSYNAINESLCCLRESREKVDFDLSEVLRRVENK
jgi:uncharacterized protein YegL